MLTYLEFFRQAVYSLLHRTARFLKNSDETTRETPQGFGVQGLGNNTHNLSERERPECLCVSHTVQMCGSYAHRVPQLSCRW